MFSESIERSSVCSTAALKPETSHAWGVKSLKRLFQRPIEIESVAVRSLIVFYAIPEACC